MSVVAAPSDLYSKAEWQGTANFWKGHRGRKAVVIHINQGAFQGSIDYMAANGVSSHFEVGAKGQVAQLVDVENSAWANGLSWDGRLRRWVCPHEHVVSPTWELLDPADENPNWVTISLENEGFSGKPWPKAQTKANVDLLVWLGRRYPSLLPYRVGATLIGHFHLDPRDKAGCPGTGVDLAALAEAANAALGVDQLWLVQWAARGVTLPADQASWAIPQAYKARAAELGACVAAETYVHPGLSVAVFEHGLIYYVKAHNRAVVELVDLGV